MQNASEKPAGRSLESNGSRPKVLIIGAGFGGLEAARALANAPVDVLIADRQNHHCFQPLLYQVATAALSPADVAWPVRSLLRRQKNASVIMGEATGVDWVNRRVHIGGRDVPYDFLILATGATHSYFGHPEWAQNAPGLKTIEDATRIRADLLLAFEQAELEDDERERRKLLTFVVIGGGPTGVEMAGAIAEVARQSLACDFKRIDPTTARIMLIEAGPRILANFPPELSTYAHRALTRMGVDIVTSRRVTECHASGVETSQGPIEAATVIWAAGVQASPAARWLDVPADRAGRIVVGSDLAVPGREGVFAIGDTAAAADANGDSPPGIAPAAKQMGAYVGRLIESRTAKKQPPPAFVYKHQGDLATIGRKAAVVKLDRVRLTGFIGWTFWSAAHVYFLIGWRNRFVVAFSWAVNYLTYQRGARLITRAPQVKTSKESSPSGALAPAQQAPAPEPAHDPALPRT